RHGGPPRSCLSALQPFEPPRLVSLPQRLPGPARAMRGVHLVMRTILGPAIGALALVLVVTAAASTPQPSRHTLRVVIDGRSIARRFPHGPSISFRYPANWHV